MRCETISSGRRLLSHRGLFSNHPEKVNHKFGGLIIAAGFLQLPITIYQLPITHLTNQPIMTNYAKQTQFTECSNKRKLSFNKGLLK